MASHVVETNKAKVPDCAVPVIHGLTQLYDSTELSDFTIDCNEKWNPVHRLVLSLHSPVLAKACANQPHGGSIDLRKIFPPTELHNERVEALMHFMYKFDYDLPRKGEEQEYMTDDSVWLLGEEGEPQFHIRMSLLAEELNIKGLTTLATAKFKASLPSPAINPQAFIQLAKSAFCDPETLPTIRQTLLSCVAETQSSCISIYPEEPRPLLSVALKHHRGGHQRFDTSVLADGLDGEQLATAPEDIKAFRCRKCEKDQWRNDVKEDYTHYTCEQCHYREEGWRWGTKVKRQQAKAKKEQEKGGGARLLYCLGCSQEQTRFDVERSAYKSYKCNYCGWEESGYTWCKVIEV